MRRPAGTVPALWRYPVKSMQGEPLAAAWLGSAGVLGDRAYAIVEAESGRVASAKHPRKWRALFACRAEFLDPPRVDAPPPAVAITLPDGERVSSADPDVDRALSHAFGRPVRLVAARTPSAGVAVAEPLLPEAARLRETDRTPPDASDDPLQAVIRDEPIALAAPVGTFFDVAPVHVLTTDTLAALAARAPASRFDARRFRPNIVVRSGPYESGVAPEFPEHDWVGRTVVVSPQGSGPPASRTSAGDATVRLRIIDPTPRCVVVTLGTDDLPHDVDVLRTVTRANAVESRTLAPGVRFPGVVGVYAAVDQEGWLRRGDGLALAPPR